VAGNERCLHSVGARRGPPFAVSAHAARGGTAMRPWMTPLTLAEPPLPFERAQAGVIDQPAQLSALQPAVRRVLARELGVQSLADRICPVERDDGSVTLLARAEYVGSDQADALEGRLRADGHVLSEPARYVLPAALLLALSREGAAAVLAPAGDRTPTALAGV